MRPIKFRGKRVDNSEWVYGSLNLFDCKQGTESQIVLLDGSFYKVIPESIGQFIGLYDKNKKEVYEGDIMRWMDHNPDDGEFEITAAFVYQENNAQFRLDTKNFPCQYKKVRPEELEVIGNIHDNKNLLEK